MRFNMRTTNIASHSGLGSKTNISTKYFFKIYQHGPEIASKVQTPHFYRTKCRRYFSTRSGYHRCQQHPLNSHPWHPGSKVHTTHGTHDSTCSFWQMLFLNGGVCYLTAHANSQRRTNHLVPHSLTAIEGQCTREIRSERKSGPPWNR